MKKYNIILIHYNYDPIALLIRFFTNSYWNHCAWIFNDRFIIERNRNGTQINWFDKYNNPKLYKIKILKIKDLSKKQEEKILKCLLNYNKKSNPIKRLLSYFYIIFDKDLLEATCSGFIAEACSKANIYFHLTKKPSHITPEDINNSKIIK